ncbi:bifunctional DNA primase/polymerase [Streptomyces sp. NPDC088732]|uniref:bifunctional DNA primase/polymerase n=1 Tax=Streptomyces sp. NPDC088732 TaxID=3365879 RepID=UPI00382DF20B
MTNLLNAALDAAGRGWPVFPLHAGRKTPALHGERHCPRTGDCTTGHMKWEQRATTDPERIRAAWSQRLFNVGIATGPSGLLVVDLDTLKPTDKKGTPDGVTAFAALCERAGQVVPTTRTVRTAGGGRHLYFTAPQGARLGNTAGALAPKIDTRGWGGYVVGPGSATPHGTYTVEDDAPVVNLPEWLQTALQPPQRAFVEPILSMDARTTTYARTALERETAAIAAATEGEREATLFQAARRMGRFVAWGDLARTEVEQAFQCAGEAVGLKPHECRSTLRSALNWSIRTARPRDTA